jgi:hypothetical protein
MRFKSRAIALVGGHIIQDPQDPTKFRTSRLDEQYYGIIGDNLRGIATQVLYAEVPPATVVVIGGVTPLHKTMPNAPHLSYVIKHELIELGVPEEDIVELDIDPATTTYNQLLYLQDALQKQPQVTHVQVVSNWWHLPRVWSMILFRPELSALNDAHLRFVQLVAAEDVLIRDDQERWHPPIVAAYRWEAMRRMVAQELDGAKQVADGTYALGADAPRRFLHQNL